MKKLLRSISLIAALVLSLSASTATAAETVLAEADFSTLTNGSEDAPEIFKYSWDFTGFTGWSVTSNKTGAAGGSLYLGDGGSVKSKSLSGVSSTNGAIKVTVVAKLNKADIGLVQLNWGYSTTMTEIIEGNDWTTVEFITQPASYGNQATISPLFLIDGIFVKSIRIAQSPDFLSTPEAKQPSDADGTSFTASWKAVTGATKYFVDVYSYNAASEKVMFFDSKECTATSLKVEGLDAATTYYYVVRAANETGVSKNSAEIEIVKCISSLDTPVVKLTSCDKDGNFTAEWDAVENAEDYTVTIFKEETLAEAGDRTVMEEDFNAFTDGTFDNLDFISSSKLGILSQPGWTGDNLYAIIGAVAFNTSFGTSGYVCTPAMDLSDADGAFSVVVSMAANSYGIFTTDVVVTFTAIDAEGNESTPVKVTIDKKDFAEYTVNLTGGTAATKIRISTDSADKVFINNLEVKQLKPAGFVSTSTYAQENIEATTFSGKVEFAQNTAYKLVVTAEGRTVVANEISGISSAASEAVTITGTSGIGNVDDSTKTITIAKTAAGVITVSTPEATVVEIYDIAGRLVEAAHVAEGTTSLAVDATGIVIVKAGTAVAKIAL